jgi:uncharacterized repeat protein (TIGR01451 family)
MRRTRLTGGLAMLLTLLGLTLAVPALATPNSTIVKSVRNATTNPTGGYASTATAKPGDTIEYQLVYKNKGAGAAKDVTVSDTLAARQTYLSCTGGCTTVGSPVTTVKWNFGTVGAGASRTVTFKVTLSSSFPAGSTVVKNTAVVSSSTECPKRSNETKVTVTPPIPKLTLVKAADKTSVVGGSTIKYTLTYGNSGNGPAASTTISETIPSGTSFVGCTGTCSASGSTVTFTIGTVNAGATGSVTLTVKVNSVVDTCAICNTATIKSPSSGAAVSSNRVCITANPTSDPSTATARGSALGLKAYVPVLGLPLLNVDISHAASSKTGLGQAADSDEFGTLNILGSLGLPSIAKATLLRTTSTSKVTEEAGARQTSTSEVLGLNVLNGLVTADVLRSVASTTATGSASSFSAAGTTVANLKINGNSIVNLTPGLRIPLNGALFGSGSYVAVNEQTGSTGGPASGVLSGGTYRADLTVTAVRVYITGGVLGTLLTGIGGQPVDITIAKATAHSDHKQTRLCTSGPTKAVSGHAFVASAEIDPLLPTSTVGFVDIPASGGNARMGLTGVVLPTDGSILSTDDVESVSTGSNGASSSTASSYAQVAKACVLRVAAADCLIKATLIKSQATSTASASSRSSTATGTQFVDLVIAGTPIAGTPAPNTTISLGSLGFVVLNEQTSDGPETGHTGLTVRAIHVKLTLPLAPLLRGAEVIVAEAHSDATWR